MTCAAVSRSWRRLINCWWLPLVTWVSNCPMQRFLQRWPTGSQMLVGGWLHCNGLNVWVNCWIQKHWNILVQANLGALGPESIVQGVVLCLHRSVNGRKEMQSNGSFQWTNTWTLVISRPEIKHLKKINKPVPKQCQKVGIIVVKIQNCLPEMHFAN